MASTVSIIMPAYDVTSYIGTAIRSVLAQTFQQYELIVVNDGCPDTVNLEAALAPYRSRIRYIVQDNAGVGAARRTAVQAAQAPLISQLDPDDWWEPDYLDVQLRLFEAHPGIDLIYPNGHYVGDHRLKGKLLMDYAPSEGPVSFCSLVRGQVNIVYSALIRKEAVLKAGNFDSEFRTSEDFDLWCRMLKGGAQFAYHDAPLLHYRLRTGSLTAKSLDAQEWALKVLDKLQSTLPLTTEEINCVTERRLAIKMNMELELGKAAIARKDWAEAKWHLELYHRYRPTRKTAVVLSLLRSCPWLIGTALRTRDRLFDAGMLKIQPPRWP